MVATDEHADLRVTPATRAQFAIELSAGRHKRRMASRATKLSLRHTVTKSHRHRDARPDIQALLLLVRERHRRTSAATAVRVATASLSTQSGQIWT